MDVKSAVTAAAGELYSEFVGSLKGQGPTTEEVQAVLWATQTLAAGTVLVGNADTREAVAKAKAILANVAVSHEIDGAAAVGNLVNSALAKAWPIISQVLLTAAIAAL